MKYEVSVSLLRNRRPTHQSFIHAFNISLASGELTVLQEASCVLKRRFDVTTMNTVPKSPLDDDNPPTPTSEWERVVSKKRAIRDLDLRMHADASHANNSITAVKDASDLVEALVKGHLGSEVVARAYMQQSVLLATRTCIHFEVD